MAKSKKAPYHPVAAGKAPRIDHANLKGAAHEYLRQEARRQLLAEVVDEVPRSGGDYHKRKNPYLRAYRDSATLLNKAKKS